MKEGSREWTSCLCLDPLWLVPTVSSNMEEFRKGLSVPHLASFLVFLQLPGLDLSVRQHHFLKPLVLNGRSVKIRVSFQ